MSTIRRITRQQYLDLGRVGIPVYACYYSLTNDEVSTSYLLSLFKEGMRTPRESRLHHVEEGTYLAKFFYTLVEDSE